MVSFNYVCMYHPLCSILRPLPTVEAESIVVRRKGNLRAFGKVEHVTGDCVHLIACFIAYVEATFDNNLHYMIKKRQ